MPVDEDVMRDAYAEVRADDNDTEWAVFKYEDKLITLAAKGAGYDEFLQHYSDDERVYGFVRLETGDELSKRAKFALITWVGPSVSPLKKAKVSTDKAFVKKIIQSYAKEILADTPEEIAYDTVLEQVVAVGGANYGIGKRAE
eukprot:m.477610 g.477610  ORF g.477610 m.477610 type:complete len:143 (+) comp20883_c0_seq1:78-506(+)